MVTARGGWRRRRRWVRLLAIALLRRLTLVAIACRTPRVMARPALVSLVALSVMTGLLRVVADDGATLPWRGHIPPMVILGVFAMSGGAGRWRWATRSGLFSVVGGYGDSILPCCVHLSVFVLMNPSGTRHQEEIYPLAACTG